jgi:DNA polymerase III alpha subunit (gram-positive type)
MAALPNFAITDFETGGLDSDLHQITEVGIVMANAVSLKSLGTYHSFVKPYSSDLTIEDIALQKSGVSRADVMGGQAGATVVKEMSVFAKEHRTKARFNNKPIFVAHNATFDLGFAKKLFMLHGKNFYDYFSTELIDTLPLSRLIWGASKDEITAWKLAVVCERAGIKLSNAHSALNDARATHKLFQFMTKLMRGNLDKVGSTNVIEENTHPHRPFKM